MNRSHQQIIYLWWTRSCCWIVFFLNSRICLASAMQDVWTHSTWVSGESHVVLSHDPKPLKMVVSDPVNPPKMQLGEIWEFAQMSWWNKAERQFSWRASLWGCESRIPCVAKCPSIFSTFPNIYIIYIYNILSFPRVFSMVSWSTPVLFAWMTTWNSRVSWNDLSSGWIVRFLSGIIGDYSDGKKSKHDYP